ncbi:hypothetical protein IHE44_0003342 [Lamprotornis superbus]|uniref:Caspase recruitment domain-containing protein 19 n=1 Tax=Lamprotornis superbus TaxID=245042 RepID=A0A835NGY2_9PASS|nr:hypothetical protein IHE44_0003342 [Lamprotornis superbus]
MYFLTSTSRLNEQVVDKIVLQLNRVYPQILTNEEAEKFRNPKASLHTRLSGLLKHLQKKGDRHCQEFYRALQINAEQLFNDLPSRKILKTPDPTEIDTDKEQYMLNDRGPVFFLACFGVAAGLALFWYCCNSETQVIGRARRILGFSPIIIGRHKRPLVVALLWLLINPSWALASHVSSKEKEWLGQDNPYTSYGRHVLPSTFELHIHKHTVITYQFPAASVFALMGSELSPLLESPLSQDLGSAIAPTLTNTETAVFHLFCKKERSYMNCDYYKPYKWHALQRSFIFKQNVG